MRFAMSDIYGVQAGKVLPTHMQTIPEEDEEESYIDTTTVVNPETNMRQTTVNKNMIWGSFLLLVGLLVALHFLD